MANYKRQVSLLLTVLPEIAKEKSFALHGGTAINLFVRDMPRLSVDIDLTYIPVEDRETSFKNINTALSAIKERLTTVIPGVRIAHQEQKLKLQISTTEALIKLEVNQGIRGIIDAPIQLELCQNAQETFDAFCTIQGVPFGQLYGGKICAALDRQHPRDLFDVRDLLANEGFSEAIKTGFIFTLLSSKRPIQEILFPHFKDQQQAFTNQFQGMSEVPFSYEDYETTRKELIIILHQNLTASDKRFLLNFENATPDWQLYDFEKYPAVQWKLRNLKTLKEKNPKKHSTGVMALREKLESGKIGNL